MTVTIPLVLVIGIVAYACYRHMNLKLWHLLVCLLLGFLLAATSAAPGNPELPERGSLQGAQVNAPESGISLHVVYARYDHARQIIAGCMSAMPIASEMWEQVDRALADIPAMGAVIARLTAELTDTRLDRANLLAAIRATIGAHADGEADPLYYLRDELNARQARSLDYRGTS